MGYEFVGGRVGIQKQQRGGKRKDTEEDLKQENWQVHTGPRLIATCENRVGGGRYRVFTVSAMFNQP